MNEWIRSLVRDAVRPVRDLVDAITRRLTSIFATVTGFFGRSRAALARARSKMSTLIGARVRHALAVYTTLRWLAVTFVPRRLGDLSRSIVTWTGRELGTLASQLRGAISDTARALGQALGSVAGRLDAFSRWVTGQLGEITGKLTRVLSHLFGPLATPERLADWAGEAIGRSVGRYVVNNSVKLGALAWHYRGRIIDRSLSTLEGIVARII